MAASLVHSVLCCQNEEFGLRFGEGQDRKSVGVTGAGTEIMNIACIFMQINLQSLDMGANVEGISLDMRGERNG